MSPLFLNVQSACDGPAHTLIKIADIIPITMQHYAELELNKYRTVASKLCSITVCACACEKGVPWNPWNLSGSTIAWQAQTNVWS